MEQMNRPIDIARRLNVTRRTVYAWIRQGRLAAYKIGSRVRIDPNDLELFIKAHRRTVATCETADTAGK